MSADAQLRSFIERIERIEEEIAGLNGDKSDVFKEAKGEGFDVAAMREVLAIRRKKGKNAAAFEEREAIVALYLERLDAFADHPSLVRARVEAA